MKLRLLVTLLILTMLTALMPVVARAQDVPLDSYDICGYKYDAISQQPIEGWTITLWKYWGYPHPSYKPVISITTDAEGMYCFTDLSAGQYKVVEEIRAGWTVDGASYHEVLLPEGATNREDSGTFYNFHNFRSETESSDICGQKFDATTDEPISGWNITLWRFWGDPHPSYKPVRSTTTDAEGRYCFTDLAPGEYRVTEESREGWSAVGDSYHEIVLPDGATDPEDPSTWYNFYNQLTEELGEDICGYKYNAATDETIAGWTVTLWKYWGDPHPSYKPVASTATDANGFYCFEGLSDGQYKVVEELREGWVAVGAPYYEPLLPQEATNREDPDTLYNFHNEPETFEISGYKYVGAEGEVPGAGWEIRLWKYWGEPHPSYKPVASTTTDVDGYYCFAGLSSGHYRVTETLAADWVQLEPGYPGYHEVTLPLTTPEITTVEQPTAGYLRETTLIDLSALDDDSSHTSVTDGTLTASFAGIGEVPLPMTKQSVPDTWATWGLPPDTETAAPHVLYTGDYTQNQIYITLDQPVSVFGFEMQPATFADVEFSVTFQMFDGHEHVGGIIKTVDGDSGAKLFALSAEGQQFDTIGVAYDSPLIGFAVGQLRYSLAELPTMYNFRNIQLSSIGNFVWWDYDHDGIQDDGDLEPGIAGVTVQLWECEGTTVLDSTFTDEDGHYVFDDLMPGDYYVKFVLPAGYMFTKQDAGSEDGFDSDADPMTGSTVCTTLTPGENDMTWDAGMYVDWRTGDSATGLGTRITAKKSSTWFMYNTVNLASAGIGATQTFAIQGGNPLDGANVIGTLTVTKTTLTTYAVTYDLMTTVERNGSLWTIVDCDDTHLSISDSVNFKAIPGRDDNQDFGVAFTQDGRFYMFAHIVVCYE